MEIDFYNFLIRMATKTKKKRKLETRNTIIVLVGAALFLLIVLLFNVLSTFRGLHTRECVINMVLIEKAMQKMQKEFAFEFSLEALGSDYILKALPIYMRYGKAAFVQDEDGFMKLRPREEIARLKPLSAGENYLLRSPQCPSGANYRLIASANKPHLFDVECPKHGILEQPDSEGRYTFSGNIYELPIRDTAMGIEAQVYLPQALRIDETSVRILPKFQPETSE